MKYLPLFGYDVTVIGPRYTRKNTFQFDPLTDFDTMPGVILYPVFQRFTNTRFERAIAKKFSFLYIKFFTLQNFFQMKRYARKLLRKEKYDLIISSYGSYMGPYAVKAITEEFHLPHVADFRDVKWQIHAEWATAKEFEKLQKLYANVTNITTATAGLIDLLKVPMPEKVYTVVENGFDEDQFTFVADQLPQSVFFDILYAGVILPATPLEFFLDGINRAVAQLTSHDKLRIHIYDNSREVLFEKWQNQFPHAFKVLCFHDKIPFDEVLKRQRNAAANIIFSYPDAPVIASSKTTNLLPIRRPILLIPADQTVRNIIQPAGYTDAFESPEALTQWLIKHYTQFEKNGTLPPDVTVNEEKIAPYTRRYQVSIFARVLDRVLSQK